ncbi:hypothetical protein H9X96_01135 [Pedobacter sp. N36a]|uniref:hypothetical protein n=1 Tax=Pedobacter sp. N36a TaxID=2767996 RepID=UPI001656CEB6|nr:hypothetical protein [Pedobacter sp. N36a]MBC8984373.1 hypothetical protein [Pedobacter sp. N36a]
MALNIFPRYKRSSARTFFGLHFPWIGINKKIEKIQVSVIGRNLWMIYKKAPFDPELITLTVNAYQGFDDFAMPSLRSIGFNVNFTF